MYFSFFKLKKWGKKTAAARRHNCAVLPYKVLSACCTLSVRPFGPANSPIVGAKGGSAYSPGS